MSFYSVVVSAVIISALYISLCVCVASGCGQAFRAVRFAGVDPLPTRVVSSEISGGKFLEIYSNFSGIFPKI